MKVNENNYQEYIVDYYDNKLSAAQQKGLMSFLDRHPDCKLEFTAFGEFQVEPDASITFDKSTLRKNEIIAENKINEDNYEAFLIEDLENTISKEDKEDLNSFRNKNPQLEHEFKTVSQLKLVPDLNLSYPNKDALKKTIVLPFYQRLLYYGVGIAAALLAFVLIIKSPENYNFLSGDSSTAMAYKNENNLNTNKKDKSPNQKNSDVPKVKEKERQTSAKKNGSLSKNAIKDKSPQIEEAAAVNSFSKEKIKKQRSVTITEKRAQFAHTLKAKSVLEIHEISDGIQLETRDAIAYYEVRSDFEEESKEDGQSIFELIQAYVQNDESPLLENVSLWSIADLGVQGLSSLTSTNIDIHRERMDSGEIKYSLNTSELSFSSTFRSE